MDLSCQDYSEKAIVVRGEETKNCKEQLTNLGGKYNSRLKDGPGWIFPKKFEDKVLAFISSGKLQEKRYDISTPSNLLVDIEKELKIMSLQERLDFISKVAKIATLKDSENKIVPQKVKTRSFVNLDEEISDDDEEFPKIRKRLL